MGRRDKQYSKDLKQQIHERLESMLHNGVGQSKREGMEKEEYHDKIYSYNTYNTYLKHCKYFASYINEKHPECTTLKSAKKYVNEWLQARVDQVDAKGEHLSAWTIQTEAKALGKLYGIRPDDPKYFQAPKRNRQEIKRSRGTAERDKHFSVRNNEEFIKFCKGTGCRRNVMEKLEGRDYITRDDMIRNLSVLESRGSLDKKEQKEVMILKDALSQFPDHQHFIHHRTDKGGRSRYSPIIGKDIDQIVERMRNTAPNEKVWLAVPVNADIHGYRGEYATAIYKQYARDVADIPYDKVNKGNNRKYQSEVYVCRKDEKGKKLDKTAMLKASKALGHNRLEVVANNYIRNL